MIRVFTFIICGVWIWSGLQLAFLLPRDHLDFWLLNVGQGEAALIREPGGKLILYDGGPGEAVLSEIGKILPPWKRDIDLVIVSHNHSDHIRGLIAVLDRYNVKEIWMPENTHTSAEFRAFRAAAQTEGAKIVYPHFDTKKCLETCPVLQDFGLSQLQVFHPFETSAEETENQHDATIVLKVHFGSQSILLTGDMDIDHIENILRTCKLPRCSLDAEIFQTPHHGSRYSLTAELLQAVRAKLAVIPVGLDNKFSHPHIEVLDMLETAKVPFFRTDLDKTIHLQMYKHSFTQPLPSTTDIDRF